MRQHDVGESLWAGTRANNAFIGKSSPPVQAYEKGKQVKYQAMVDEAANQVRKGMRQQAPVLGCVHFLTPLRSLIGDHQGH